MFDFTATGTAWCTNQTRLCTWNAPRLFDVSGCAPLLSRHAVYLLSRSQRCEGDRLAPGLKLEVLLLCVHFYVNCTRALWEATTTRLRAKECTLTPTPASDNTHKKRDNIVSGWTAYMLPVFRQTADRLRGDFHRMKTLLSGKLRARCPWKSKPWRDTTTNITWSTGTSSWRPSGKEPMARWRKPKKDPVDW